MARTPNTVLVDASPLRTQHRVRGIGRYVHDLLMGLAETRDAWGSDLQIVALHDLPVVGKVSVSSDLRAVCEEALASPAIGYRNLARLRRLTLQLAAVRAGVQLVHETDLTGSAPASFVPRLSTCYDLIPLCYPEHYLSGRLHTAIEKGRAWRRYRLAQRVVAISSRTREDVISMLGVPEDRIEAVQTGIDLDMWVKGSDAMTEEEVRSRHGLQGPFALYVGGADYRKNLRGIFKAVRAASEKQKVVLAWAGYQDRKTAASARKMAAEEGVEQLVRSLGYVDDATLRCLYRAALAQLFLSRLEGFGLPVAEAMACGCPSIVATRSGCDEIVADAGIVVDADDVSGAANALLDLHARPTWRQELAERSKKRVSGMTRAAMAMGYLAAYRRTLGH